MASIRAVVFIPEELGPVFRKAYEEDQQKLGVLLTYSQWLLQPRIQQFSRKDQPQ